MTVNGNICNKKFTHFPYKIPFFRNLRCNVSKDRFRLGIIRNIMTNVLPMFLYSYKNRVDIQHSIKKYNEIKY